MKFVGVAQLHSKTVQNRPLAAVDGGLIGTQRVGYFGFCAFLPKQLFDQPALLSLGKPAELIEFSRRKEFRDALPRVIRPDLVLTEEGWTIAEVDSVPGGIGLTAWLNQTYASLGSDVIGNADGMLDGFATVPAY